MNDLLFHVYDKNHDVIVHSLSVDQLEEMLKKEKISTSKHDIVPVWEPPSDIEASYQMNAFTDLLFVLIWISLVIWAIRTMIRGYSAYIPPSNTSYDIKKRTVTKLPHPEMVDVKQGDELLVVNFGEEEPKDPLLKSLQDRIDKIDLEEEDEDDDDDGDVIVRV